MSSETIVRQDSAMRLQSRSGSTNRRSPHEGSPRRVEALSDGVFAIVMTLLVLSAQIPNVPAAQLGHSLALLVPTLLTYGLTFTVLGVLWFGHRTQFEYIVQADHPLVWLNLMFLGVVALVPFSAALLARYSYARLAVVIYGIHLALASLAHGLSWAYATLQVGVLTDSVGTRSRQVTRRAAFLPALCYLLATGVGALKPLAGLVCYLLVPVPFVSGFYYRRIARLGERG